MAFELLPFPNKPLTDIAAKLEELAAEIRSGQLEAESVVLVIRTEDLSIKCRAYGQWDNHGQVAPAIGVLHLGIAHMVQTHTDIAADYNKA